MLDKSLDLRIFVPYPPREAEKTKTEKKDKPLNNYMEVNLFKVYKT